MKPGCKPMLKAREITKDLVAERCGRALRRFVGRGKEYSTADMAALTGQDERTVDSHCAGEGSPYLFAWLRYAAVLPPSFTAELLEIAGLVGVHEAGTAATAQEVHVRACELNAMLARHLADGRIDHLEEAEHEPAIRSLHATLGAWLARFRRTAKRSDGR